MGIFSKPRIPEHICDDDSVDTVLWVIHNSELEHKNKVPWHISVVQQCRDCNKRHRQVIEKNTRPGAVTWLALFKVDPKQSMVMDIGGSD